MSEPRLGSELTARFSGVLLATLAGYAALVIAVFAVAAEGMLGRSLERSADVVQSLLGRYADPGDSVTSAAPAMLAAQLVDKGHFVITRTVTDASRGRVVYYLSPDMPATRLDGLANATTPEAVSGLLEREMTLRARWRYRVLHRQAADFDIYVIASRESYVGALVGLAAVCAVLLPLGVLLARRSARRVIASALAPLERVATEIRAIGPADLGRRIATPTGQAEVTELGEGLNRMLERVDRAHRALESFTADASHELRTPLTHVRAQAQWALAEGRTTAEAREALAAIEAVLDQTSQMIESLLLIARGETRQLALSKRPFDLTAVVREVEEIGQAMAAGRDLVVETTLNGPVWAVGDSGRTRHILLNLASNAVRYAVRGTVTLGVRRSGDRVEVSVRDTGPGIAPEHQQRIFDRFFRVDSSRSRAHGGAGLGLAIARLLAELQDGELTVTSAPGAGSTFTLSLPAAPAADGMVGPAG